MNYKWVLPFENEIDIEYDFHPILLKVLQRRGFKLKDEIDSFLNTSLLGLHDPKTLKNVDKAVQRIIKAIDNQEKILIYGDYDVDGITAIAIFVQFFRMINKKVEFYVPHRIKEGYGLNINGVNKAKEKNIDLIITVDTGVSNLEEVDYANSLGIDVLITDHHNTPKELPKAFTILNPNQPDCLYPNKNLAGVGVAFKLIHACLRELKIEESKCKKFLKSLLDYVTLGTIADLVSLTGENRKIVASGLKQINKSTFPGIRVILDQLVIGDRILSVGTIAFRVTPKLNASGRTDHGKLAAKLLIEENPSICRELFSKLELCNRERQFIEESDLKKALSLVESERNNSIIIIKDPSFHAGVNGIIASRLVERYHLPAIVFAPDENGNLKGSARSIKSINIYNCINSVKNKCISFGGHALASGITLEESQYDSFKTELNNFVKNNYKNKDFDPILNIDAHLYLKDICKNFINDLKLMEPFGLGNSEPLFLTREAIVASSPKILKGKHIKFNIIQENNSFEVIGFNLSKKIAPHLKENDKVDLVYRVGINNWLGQERIQLELVDFNKVELN